MMRIIAGQHRSRKLFVPETPEIRPTSDRAREALFSILLHRLGSFEDARVCDACCGSGALGLEALSRGAAHAYFLDNNPEALTLARKNANLLKETARCAFLPTDITRPPRATVACDLLLLDPPYHTDLASRGLDALTRAGWATPAALATVEIARADPFTPPDGWTILQERPHGAARIILLERVPVAP